MPKFNVVSPDGLTYQVNAPEGATQEQAIKYVQDEVAAGRLSPTPKQEEQAVPKQDGGGLAGSLRRIDLNAGTNIANIPSALADSLASATAWAGGKLGIGDGTYIPAPRFQVSEEDKPQGFVEEFASEAIPYLIPTGVGAGVGAASRVGRVADALGRNAAQSVVGSLANNSDGALDGEFAEELAANAVLGAGAEKVLGGVANTIRAGKEARRARMAQTAVEEQNVNASLEGLSKTVHNISSNHNDFEKGLPIKDASKNDLTYQDGPRKGEVIREKPKTIGELQQMFTSQDPRFVAGGSHSYLPKSFNDYLSSLTGGKYNLNSTDIPEKLLNTVPSSAHTNRARSFALEQAKDQLNSLDNYRFNSVRNNNEAILMNSNPVSRALHKPMSDIGALTQEQQKMLGLSRLERAVATIGSKANASLPLDVGTYSRFGSDSIISSRKQGIREAADEAISGLKGKKEDFILKKLNNGKLKDGTGDFFSDQADAWNLAKKGAPVSSLTDNQLENLLISSSQSMRHRGSRIPDYSGQSTETPLDILRGVREIDEFKEGAPLGTDSVGSTVLGFISGGATTAAQASAALLNRNLNNSIARDIRRVSGETIRGDAARNAIGDAVDNVGTNVNVAGVLGGDMDGENEKRIEQLDDWATKNGIPSEILSQAVAIKGSDLGSLKGINAIKGLALDLHTESRANDSTISLSESFNPDHTLATRQISQAMREAMNGLSDDEQEEIIDDYLDSVHLEEDEKLVGLKLQRAIQKAIQHALDKSS